mmetsp:Transcript_17695/g.28721  ORF Transcript_17695/g.28721 Transcript_17695/m.28721 type:complete len:227 (+) Transcript_17695:183-863(+)
MEDGPSTRGSTKRGKRQPKLSVKAVAVLEDSREKEQQKKAREVERRKRKPNAAASMLKTTPTPSAPNKKSSASKSTLPSTSASLSRVSGGRGETGDKGSHENVREDDGGKRKLTSVSETTAEKGSQTDVREDDGGKRKSVSVSETTPRPTKKPTSSKTTSSSSSAPPSSHTDTRSNPTSNGTDPRLPVSDGMTVQLHVWNAYTQERRRKQLQPRWALPLVDWKMRI